MNNLNETVEKINTTEDFLEFTQILIEDFSLNKWENNNLADYLEGLNIWVDDMDGYFENMKDFDALEKIKKIKLIGKF